LHFAFGRRPLFRRLRFVLFAVALLLPVLSALGFVAMGRELAANSAAAAETLAYLSSQNAAQRLAITEWKDWLLNGYFATIGAAFVAREIRNLIERRRDRLISVSYPGRTIRVPRGWSVLEASRGFHLPHASMCGGRARCSTCRVQVTAGEDACPPPGIDEQATLERIRAAPDVRLACQLRPQGDISVTPLVRTALPVYRAKAPPAAGEKEIVVLFCDFRNRADLRADQLPQDLLYVLTLYVEGLDKVIRAHGGTLSYVEPDSVCALFGFRGGSDKSSQRALQAAGAIEGVISDLNDRLGRQPGNRLKIAVTIHAGRAAVGEIGSAEPTTVLAIGEAIDAANELRRLAAAQDAAFAISERVFADAGLNPTTERRATLRVAGADTDIAVLLSDSAPVPSPSWTLHGQQTRRTALRRLWSG
jgi:adenylate cyclase